MTTKTTTKIRGSWMPEGQFYEGIVVNHWNGWAVPLFDQANAQRIVADQNSYDYEECERMYWDEGTIVVVNPAYPDEPDLRIDPDENGLYSVMGGYWCWETEDQYAPNANQLIDALAK
jgi:hypothetical protein